MVVRVQRGQDDQRDPIARATANDASPAATTHASRRPRSKVPVTSHVTAHHASDDDRVTEDATRQPACRMAAAEEREAERQPGHDRIISMAI